MATIRRTVVDLLRCAAFATTLTMTLNCQVSAQQKFDYKPLDTSKSFEQTMEEIQNEIRSLGNAKKGGSDCSKCAEACEMVCPAQADAKCLAELRVMRERMFAACRKQGRL